MGGVCKKIDARLGADAGDEALTSGACMLYAGNNAMSGILKSVYDLDYDTASAQQFLTKAHPECENGMTPEQLEEWVNQYIAEGNSLPLLDGGGVTFTLQVNQDDAPQPCDVVFAKFTRKQAEICVGHVPGIDLDNAYHSMVFVEKKGNTMICRNSWANQKELVVPGKAFSDIDYFYALNITDVKRV